MTGRPAYFEMADGRRVPATITGRPLVRQAKEQHRRLRELARGAPVQVVCGCRPSRPPLLAVARWDAPVLAVWRAGWPGALLMLDPDHVAAGVTAEGEPFGPRLAVADVGAAAAVRCPTCRKRWTLDLPAVWRLAAGPARRQVDVAGVSQHHATP